LQDENRERREAGRRTARDDVLDQLDQLAPIDSLDQTNDSTYRQRRGDLSLTTLAGRNNFRLAAFAEDQDYDTGGNDRLLFGASATWLRDLTRRSQLAVTAGWQRSEFDEDDQTDDEISANINFAHGLRDDLFFDVGYDLYYRMSDDEDGNYAGSTIFARLRKTF
jgi:uncharacterized protein (PEP-CTERM system associated)